MQTLFYVLPLGLPCGLLHAGEVALCQYRPPCGTELACWLLT